MNKILTDENLTITHSVLEALIDHYKKNEPYATNTINCLEQTIETMPLCVDEIGKY